MTFFRRTTWCSAAVIAAISFSAQAQDSGGLEEIVVTAQKREQSMQDVGIAVTAFTGDRLRDMGIDSLEKMQLFAPGLRISPTITGVPQYSIRGVGESADTSALSSSPVALHINEVAQPYPVAISNLLFDLQRVEVLRGPQGDLFGLNSTAGTINWTTNKPTEEFASSISVELGEYDRRKTEGFINGALGDTVSARFAFSYNNRGEGWQVNEATGEKLGEFKKTGARMSFNFAPSDTFTADLEFHYSRDDSDGFGMRNMANYVGLDPVPTLLGDPNFLLFAEPSQAYNGTGWTSYSRGVELEAIALVDTDMFPSGTKPYVDRKGHGGSLIMNWDLGNMTVTSVTGFENFEREELSDSDGDEIQDSNQFFQSDLTMWSQELRLASAGDGSVHWTVGANVASDELEQLTMFIQPENADFPGVGGQKPTQDRDISAVFGHVDYSINDRWELVAGLRYTKEARDQTNITTYKMGHPLDIVELLSGSVFVSHPTDPFALGTPLTDADFSCFFILAPCVATGTVLSKNIEFKEWSGKLGLNYFANDDWMLYGSFARGFKSGGFLDTAASNSSSFNNSKAEFLNAWELGAKGEVNGNIRLNTSVFFYDYKDQQVGGFLVDPLFGPLGQLVNAPKSEVYGGEIELLFVPSDLIEITQNLSYSRGEFKEFVAVDEALSRDTILDPANNGFYVTVTRDRAGERVEMPEIQYSGSVAFNWVMRNNLDGGFVLDYSYQDEVATPRTWTDAVTGSVNSYDLPSYWLVNTRFTIADSEAWEVTLFADNVFDEEYLLDYTRFNQGIVQMVGLPRTWGVRLRYDF